MSRRILAGLLLDANMPRFIPSPFTHQLPCLNRVLDLQQLPASGLLLSRNGQSTLRSDLLLLGSFVESAQFDIIRDIPLLRDVIRKEADHIVVMLPEA